MTREPVRLAVLGDPLAFTLSPVLHRTGLAAAGLSGDSRARRTPSPELGATLNELEREGLMGVNLTAPLKKVALNHLSRVSDRARRARSVNTIGFDPAGRWGDTTDGPGFLDLLQSLGREPRLSPVLILGAGGAARSLVFSLSEAGASSITVAARDPDRVTEEWEEIGGVSLVRWGSRAFDLALGQAAAVVNATPVDPRQGSIAIDRVPRDALIVDLRYGPTLEPWIAQVRAHGYEAVDGLGLLVFQARRSLSLWLEREVPLEPLLGAVGWPR